MKREYKIVLIILLAGLFARLYGIGTESFWLDETISIIWVKHGFMEGLTEVVTDVHQPLYYILLWGWTQLFGLSEVATRLLSTLFDTGSILLMYLIARRMGGERLGLIASSLFALSPFMIHYSQEARMYTLLVFLSLGSMYCYLRLKEELTPRWSLLYLIASTLMMYTHIFGALMLLVQSIDYLVSKRRIHFHALQAVIPVAFIPGLLIALREFTRIRGDFWIPAPSLSTLWVSYLKFSGGIILALLFAGIVAMALRRYRPDPLLLYWLLVPATILFLYSQFFTPLYQARYVIFSLPAFYLIISGMIMTTRRYHLHVLGIVLIVSAVTIGVNAHQTNKDDWRMINKEVESIKEEGDIILVHPYQHVDPLLLYRHPSCLPDKWHCKKNNLYMIYPTHTCCDENTTLSTPGKGVRLGDVESIVMVLLKNDARYEDDPTSAFTNKTKTYDRLYDGSIRIVRYE